MSTYSNGEKGGFANRAKRSWLYDPDPYFRAHPKTFDDAVNDQRLKRALKRAVKNEEVPPGLADSIGRRIRVGHDHE